MKNILSECIPLVLLPFTFCVFGPIELYFMNSDVLWFHILNILPIVIIAFFLFCTTLIAMWRIIPLSVKNYFVILLFGIGLAFYVQGNFLQLNYGLLDGQSINWNRYTGYGIFNTLIWALCIATPFVIAFFRRELLNKAILFVTMFLLVVQTGTLIFLATISNPNQSQAVLTTNNMYSVSDKQNIIVFILDSFDAKYMEYLLDREPELTDQLDGFTFYSNTVGLYPYTLPSVPCLLTGLIYQNEIPLNTWLDNSFINARLYPILKENNFDIGIYTASELVSDTAIQYIDNMHDFSGQIENIGGFIKTLYRFTAVKYFPHILKSWVWMYSGDFYQYQPGGTYYFDDLAFYHELIKNGLSIEADTNSFRLFHLNGSHSPYQYNESVHPVEQGFGNVYDQSRGALQIVFDYIDFLKEKDVYENTLIIIMADHGQLEYGQNPSFLVRDSNSTTGFLFSTIPVSYIDFSVMLEQHLQTQISCKEFLAKASTDRTTRSFYYSKSTQAPTFNPQYLSELFEYVFINNGSSLPNAHFTGNIYSSNDSIAYPIYILGSAISFNNGNGNNAREYFRFGLGYPEEEFTWSESHISIFTAKIDEPVVSDLRLDIMFNTINTFIGDGGSQIIKLYANDQLVDEEVFYPTEGFIVHSFTIPYNAVDEYNNLELRFEYPNAQALGNRILAICFVDMTINDLHRAQYNEDMQTSIYEIGEVIRFASSHDEYKASDFFATGLSYPESEFTWSEGYESLFIARFTEPVVSDLSLNIKFNIINTYIGDGGSQDIRLYASDQIIEERTFLPEGGPQEYSFTIPSDSINENNVLRLRFVYPNAQLAGDRILAICYSELMLSYEEAIK